MKIITIPNPVLRQKAQPVADPADPNFQKFLREMKEILRKTTNPRGVGLAGPQVNQLYRIFLIDIDDQDKRAKTALASDFINPTIVKHSDNHTFGPDPENPQLEGCLSMPLLYGPVPRWEWVEVEYQTMVDGKLAEKKDRFDGFQARVFQHELDHLNGILFTDYALQYDLPVYREVKKELVEIKDRSALELY